MVRQAIRDKNIQIRKQYRWYRVRTNKKVRVGILRRCSIFYVYAHTIDSAKECVRSKAHKTLKKMQNKPWNKLMVVSLRRVSNRDIPIFGYCVYDK